MPLRFQKEAAICSCTLQEGSAYCCAPLHVCVKNYFQSENFGCQRKMADFSGVFEKVV